MSVRLPPRIVALTPGVARPAHAAVDELVRAARAAFAAGLRGLVLRESSLPDREYLELAVRLRALFAVRDGAWLCLHDRPHLAVAVGADAVHVGGASLAPADVRAWLAPEIALGLSTHAGDDARTWSAADYVFHGPLHATTKPGARPPIGYAGLQRAVAASARPVWALGGIEPEHAVEIASCGAQGLAVLSGLWARADVAARTREYVAAWK